MILFGALLVVLTNPPPTVPPMPQWYGGRVYTSARVHVGMRPSMFVDRDEVAIAVTVQITGDLF